MNFVFDLDGTICFKGKRMSKRIIDALHAVEKEGHRVLFASARPVRDMLPVLHPSFHQHLLIGGNGSMIASEQTVIYSKSFKEHDISVIKKLLEKQEATFLIDGEWDYTYTGPQNHPIVQNVDLLNIAQNVPFEHHTRILKILVLHAKNWTVLANTFEQLDVVMHRHESEGTLDISPAAINKRTALQVLGIEQEGYIAFGNDANDIELF